MKTLGGKLLVIYSEEEIRLWGMGVLTNVPAEISVLSQETGGDKTGVLPSQIFMWHPCHKCLCAHVCVWYVCMCVHELE